MNWNGPLEGSEFTVGAGRGSTRGGDWTVSYVRKPIDDTTLVEVEQNCFGGGCTTTTQTRSLRDVWLKGVEFNWSRPFVTIKDRVQIGIDAGGGIASAKGNIQETVAFEDVFTNPVTKQVIRNVFSDIHTIPASDVLYAWVPLIKFEVQGAVIVHPSFKIKASGGLNMPSTSSVRIALVYLIGAR